MLVLTRKIGEQVLIPELNITVTVLSTGTNRVQLGFRAPQQVIIARPERACRAASTQRVAEQRVVTYSCTDLAEDESSIDCSEAEFVVA